MRRSVPGKPASRSTISSGDPSSTGVVAYVHREDRPLPARFTGRARTRACKSRHVVHDADADCDLLDKRTLMIATALLPFVTDEMSSIAALCQLSPGGPSCQGFAPLARRTAAWHRTRRLPHGSALCRTQRHRGLCRWVRQWEAEPANRLADWHFDVLTRH